MKRATILGAIAGDTIGSIYEFNPTKNYNFPLIDEGTHRETRESDQGMFQSMVPLSIQYRWQRV